MEPQVVAFATMWNLLIFVLQQTKTEFQNLEIACEITSKSEKDKLSRDMRVLFICVIKYLLKWGFVDGSVLPKQLHCFHNWTQYTFF